MTPVEQARDALVDAVHDLRVWGRVDDDARAVMVDAIDGAARTLVQLLDAMPEVPTP